MCSIKRAIMLFLVSAVFHQVVSAQEEDWTQWRGPNRDGIVTSYKGQKNYPKELKKKWNVAVGEGVSSPIISGNKIYLISRQNDKEVVSCLDLNSGKVLWSDGYAADYVVVEAGKSITKAPRATPVIQNGRLYTAGISGAVSSYEAKTGKLLWRKNVADKSDKPYPQFGYSVSPLIVDGLLIVSIGGGAQSALAAFNAESGELKWKWVGEYKYVDEGIGYSSPIVIQRDGTSHLITLTDTALVGLSPSDGKLLWKFPFPLEWGTAATPIIHNQNIIISDKNKGTVAVRLFKKGNDWMTEQAWQNEDVFLYMSAPVIRENLLFGLSSRNKGQFFSLDLNTGKTIWKSEGRDGEHASLMIGGEDLFIQKLDGELLLIKCNAKTFEPIRRYKVADSSTWAHPILLQNQILIRGWTNLSLWDLR